jgi:monoamine oxidase
MAHTPGFARLSTIVTQRLAELRRTRGAEPGEEPESEMASPISRRTVLRGLAASGAIVPLGCGESDEGFDVRVAVVGAGMAGTHCAVRLHEAGIDVQLFEASDRVGGRMFTSREGHPEGQSCELGGELVDSNHAAMWCLAEELGITLDDRLVDGVAVDTWFVAGAIVPEATIVEQFTAVAPAFAAAVDAADTDDAAYETLDLVTLSDWLDDNCPAETYPELHAVLTSAYRGEFGLEPSDQSALNLLYLIGSDDPDPFRIFGESDERWHAHEGSDAFVTRLADRLPNERLFLQHAMVSLARRGDGYEIVFDAGGEEITVTAHRVVLALPWTILRELDLERSELSAEKRDLIDTLGYGTNAKIMGWFQRPVWREDHAASGSVTSDGAMQQGWDSSIGQDGAAGIFTNFLGAATGASMQPDGVEAWYTGTVLPELDAVWPGSAETFMDGTITPMLWPRHPFTKASYTCYRPGQWATWATEGEPDGGVHFCGEHCSADFQGWMEGAAETGALTAAALIDELGGTPSPELQCIVEAKTVVEQPAFGKLSTRPRWRSRRRALRDAALRLRAP